MAWENILKISTTDAVADAKRFMPEESGVVAKIKKILSTVFVQEYIQEILESPPNPKESAIRALVNKIDEAKRTLTQIIPTLDFQGHRNLFEGEMNDIVAKLKSAINKIKKL